MRGCASVSLFGGLAIIPGASCTQGARTILAMVKCLDVLYAGTV